MTPPKFSLHAIERFAERFPAKASRMYAIFEASTLYKGWINNTRLMATLVRKYGDVVGQQQVRIAEGVAFIIGPRRDGEMYVITCVPATQYIDSRLPWLKERVR
jgi:hypothetical protein